jgi:hypothetical protein
VSALFGGLGALAIYYGLRLLVPDVPPYQCCGAALLLALGANLCAIGIAREAR